MKYYGIKTPTRSNCESYIYWITSDKHTCWELFFGASDKQHYAHGSMSEAKKAYEAIGYECVELEIFEAEKIRYLGETNVGNEVWEQRYGVKR